MIKLQLVRKTFKRILVASLVLVGLAAEAIPEETAKIVVVPCLAFAILIELAAPEGS